MLYWMGWDEEDGAGKVSSTYYLRQSIILFMAFHLSLLSQSPYSTTTTGLQNSSARCQLNGSDQPPTIPAYHLYPTRGFGLKRGVPHVNKKPRDQHSMVVFLGHTALVVLGRECQFLEKWYISCGLPSDDSEFLGNLSIHPFNPIPAPVKWIRKLQWKMMMIEFTHRTAARFFHSPPMLIEDCRPDSLPREWRTDWVHITSCNGTD